MTYSSIKLCCTSFFQYCCWASFSTHVGEVTKEWRKACTMSPPTTTAGKTSERTSSITMRKEAVRRTRWTTQILSRLGAICPLVRCRGAAEGSVVHEELRQTQSDEYPLKEMCNSDTAEKGTVKSNSGHCLRWSTDIKILFLFLDIIFTISVPHSFAIMQSSSLLWCSHEV